MARHGDAQRQEARHRASLPRESPSMGRGDQSVWTRSQARAPDVHDSTRRFDSLRRDERGFVEDGTPNGREADYTIEIIQGEPRKLKVTSGTTVEELVEGPEPAPTT